MEKQEKFYLGLCLAGAYTNGITELLPDDHHLFWTGRKLCINRKVTEMLMGASKASLKDQHQLIS